MTSSLGKGLNLRTLGEQILSAVTEHFAVAGVALPTRQYLAPGTPELIAWDCEQLVVSLSAIGWGAMGDSAPLSPKIAAQSSAISLRHAIISVQLVECTPPQDNDGNPPDPAVLHAAGQDYFTKAGLLSQAMVTLVAQVRHGLDPTDLVQPGIINSLGPEGGYHGLETQLLITAGNLS